jgi:hypothetical protein
MNVEIGTETPIFLFWKYLFRNFGILSLQCENPSRCFVQLLAIMDAIASSRQKSVRRRDRKSIVFC